MKKILSIINIILPIILFSLLFLFDYSDNIIYIIIMSLFVGWIIPYINLMITGLSVMIDNHHKLSLVFNILNILLNALLIFLIALIYEKKFLIMIVEYAIMLILSIINTIYFEKKVDEDSITEKKEYAKIKKIKKENDGIIK